MNRALDHLRLACQVHFNVYALQLLFFVAVIYSDFILFAQLFLISNFYMFKITQNMH